MLNKNMLNSYYKEQKENAKLKNRVRFIKKYKDYMTFKQRIRHLIRYSPSRIVLVQGKILIEGMRRGIDKET